MDGRVNIDIPPGTFESTVTFLLADLLALPDIAALLIAGAIDFQIDGDEPDRDLSLSVAYDPANLPEGARESDLRLWRVQGSQASFVEGARVDTAANEVVALVRRGGQYVVAAERPNG